MRVTDFWKYHIFRVSVCLLCAMATPSMAQQNKLQMAPQTMSPMQKTMTPPPPTATTQPKTAPNVKTKSPTTTATSAAEPKTPVYLENAETFSYDQARNADAQLLKGNVRFRHDDAYLYCDSAYFYEQQNSFTAYGHVRIVQGDTLFIYGDVLYYDGNTKLARLRRNVRMNNRDVTLVTDSLNYDRMANVGYYYTGGKLYDESNVLTSVFGHYYPGERLAVFRHDVLLTNPNFTMDADTLKYNTESAVAEIVGPTTIVYAQETTIYSELGYYNTRTEQSLLRRNSSVKHVDGQTLTGDSILYNKRQGEGRAYKHVVLNDSAKQMSFFGHFVYYKEDGDVALAYDSALMVEHSTPDTIYLNADTLYAYAVDSTEKVVHAYHNVRMFRHDVQAVCDSANYNTRDSVLHLMQQPVAWSGNRQITGDTMHIYSVNGNVERLQVVGAAFVCEQHDSLHYNQLSGKELVAYLSDRELRQVNIRGNAVSLYFPLDNDSVMIGLNQTESSYLTVYLKQQKIDRIVLFPSPTGVLTPMEMVTDDMLRMPGFSWQADVRPDTWQAVFDRPERQKTTDQQPRRRPGHVEPDDTATADKQKQQTTPTDTQQMPARFDGGSSGRTAVPGGVGGKTTLKTNTSR